jgi:hypothetical protein
VTKIGYQDGITAFFDWYRKQPGVPQRGPGYDPEDIDTWPWPDKMERTLRILKDDHDAEVVTPPNPPDGGGTPEPALKLTPPMAYHVGTNNADPRYCCFESDGTLRDGLHWEGALLVDELGVEYNADGLILSGWHLRDRNVKPPGTLPANSMDQRAVCEPYTGTNGKMIGGEAGYPEESYL